uniref:Uncharacterized protein n=1 Tax=Nicotiana tabacum TaxID=4097 RepID=A0A1S4A229_TOBAC|nr:PREDICTED: uncharacterized protein LOC107792987 [Nicotiana tabacum]
MQLHTLRHDNASIEAYVQKAKGIADRLVSLQHPISNDDLVEFVLARLGLVYRPFTRSLESRQEDIMFDALYGLILNEERQLKRDETINVIAPTAQFTQSSIYTTRGHGRGRGGRGRGRSSIQGFRQNNQNRNFQVSNQSTKDNQQSSNYSELICHNYEGKGHIARVCPSPRANNISMVSGRPTSNLMSSPNPPTQT